MKYIANTYMYSEEEISLLRKVINKAKGSKDKFDALALVKSQKY